MLNIQSLFNPKIWENPGKAGIGILLVLMVAQEWRRGWFRDFRGYLKNLSFKPYAVIFTTFSVLFLSAFFQDRFLLEKIQGLQGPVGSFLLACGRAVGENIKFWYLLLSFYWIARLLRSDRWSAGSFGALLSSILAGLLAHTFKFVFMRTRPTETLDPYSFFNYHDMFHNSKAHQSLPSGDVSLVSAAAGYLFFAIPNPVLRLLALVIPLANAFARVTLNRHWASDTLAAMGLGLMAAWFFWSFKEYQRRKPA